MENSDYAKALSARLQQSNTPLSAGKIHRDDLTSQQLAIVGWQAGDPIPADLGATLQQLRDEAVEELKAASYADPEVQTMAEQVIKKLGKSSLIKIEDLPPPQQRKVKELLIATKNQQHVDNAVDAANAELPAFIQGEDRAKLLALSRKQAESGFAVVDDRIESTQAAATGSEPTEPTEPTEPAASAAGSATSVPPSNCPCCDWPIDQDWSPEISDADKLSYLAALLGQRRFERRQLAFGSKVEFNFRTITVREYKAIMLELSAQVRNEVVVGNAEYVAAWQDMRLAMSLASVSLQGNVLLEQPTYTDWLLTDEGKAAEPTKQMYGPTPIYCQNLSVVFNQEPLRLALQDQFSEFETVLEILRKKASDENFW